MGYIVPTFGVHFRLNIFSQRKWQIISADYQQAR